MVHEQIYVQAELENAVFNFFLFDFNVRKHYDCIVHIYLYV